MGQRAGIIILALFVTCFVGSLAASALYVVNGVTEAVKNDRNATPKPFEPDPEPEQSVDSSEPTTPTVPTVPTEPDDTAAPESDDYFPPEIATAEYAIFHLGNAKPGASFTLLQKLIKGTKLKLFRDSAPDSAVPPYLVVRDVVLDDYPPIEGPTLEDGQGLSKAMIKGVPLAKRVTVVDAVLPLHDTSLLDVSKLLLVTAQGTAGVLWDADAQEYLSPDSWKTRRVMSWEKSIPYALMHFTVYVETRGRFVDLKSGGLTHFGLPELEMVNVPTAHQDYAVAVLNAIAQLLVERGVPPEPGPMSVVLADIKHKTYRTDALSLAAEDALKEVDVTLVGKADDKGAVLQVTFPGKGAQGDRIIAGITSLFGTQDVEE